MDMRELGLDGISSPEQMQQRLTMLALQRETLHETGGPRESLERNRLEIGRCQYELSKALIRRYLGQSGGQRAA
jgi:hypothetical protein